MLRQTSLAILASILLLLNVGCALSPEERLVGVWTPVADESVLPPIPIPGMEKRIEGFMRNIVLKVRSDKTFVLASAPPVEGKWSLEGDEMTLTPGKGALTGPMGNLMTVMTGRLNKERTRITLIQPTPIGEVLIVLRKSA